MNTNMQLPRLQDLYLNYPLAEEDYRQLRLPPLIARPRAATPPLPVPTTLPAESRRQQGVRKTKATKSREAQGPTARGGSSPRKTKQLISSVTQLNLSLDTRRTLRPLVMDYSKRVDILSTNVVMLCALFQWPPGSARYQGLAKPRCLNKPADRAGSEIFHASNYRVFLMICGSISPREIFYNIQVIKIHRRILSIHETKTSTASIALLAWLMSSTWPSLHARHEVQLRHVAPTRRFTKPEAEAGSEEATCEEEIHSVRVVSRATRALVFAADLKRLARMLRQAWTLVRTFFLEREREIELHVEQV
ncbi:hypothetical protein JB92DRAFT_3100384 [Gautieria morchelliformis]|nr:hypothetical protein JB92DRAFT_3100384 [Gautieria morchelliformis]